MVIFCPSRFLCSLDVRLGWDACEHGLNILGVSFDMDCARAPLLLNFVAEKARRRLECIAVAAQTLAHRARHVRSLVLPLFTWTGAVATLPRDTLVNLRRQALNLSRQGKAVDIPAVILFEIFGWECDPLLATHWAALRQAVRYVARPSECGDLLPLAVSLQPWMECL